MSTLKKGSHDFHFSDMVLLRETNLTAADILYFDDLNRKHYNIPIFFPSSPSTFMSNLSHLSRIAVRLHPICSPTKNHFLLNVHKCFFMCVPLQLMVTGARGSSGGSALLPAVAEKGLAPVSVIIRLLATGVDRARETPLSCPAVTLRPVQVRLLPPVVLCCVRSSAALKFSFLFFLSGGPQTARGSIIGNINDIEFGIAILNASVTDSNTGGKLITATITNVPRTLGQFSDTFFYSNPHFFDIHHHRL